MGHGMTFLLRWDQRMYGWGLGRPPIREPLCACHPDRRTQSRTYPQPDIGVHRRIGILLVDDQPAVRRVCDCFFNWSHGWLSLAKRSSAEALALAEVLRPDVVIMDVRMPGMDGIEATALLVAMLPRCSVIILTIRCTADVRDVPWPAGARAFVEKGRPEELVDATSSGAGFAARGAGIHERPPGISRAALSLDLA